MNELEKIKENEIDNIKSGINASEFLWAYDQVEMINYIAGVMHCHEMDIDEAIELVTNEMRV